MPFTIANQITVVRIILVPFFVLSVLHYSPDDAHLRWVALGIFLFAVISDLVDGFIARTFNQKTPAGALLDPLADKLLLISAFVCLYVVRDRFGGVQLPMWFVVAVISRDLILMMGTVVLHLLHCPLKIRPGISGRATTFFQVLTVTGIMLQISLTRIIWWIAIVFTAISAVNYIGRGIVQLHEGEKH